MTTGIMASDESKFGNLLKVFLCQPDKQRFREFFGLCYLRSRNYLGILRAKGWSLPVDARTDKDPIDDLAIDVLGPLFASGRGEPFRIIFAYFDKLGIGDYQKADPELLTNHFMILLRSFTRQEMHRLRGEIDPAKARIKRRIHDILNGSEYISISNKHGMAGFVGHKDFYQDMRIEAQSVTRELIEQLATQSLLSTIKDTDLCRDFFRRLNEMKEHQNFVDLRMFVSILVAVRISFAEEGMVLPHQPLSPANELANKKLSEAIERSLSRVWLEDIQKFVSNGRLSEDEGQIMLKACRNYLQDRCNGNGTDSIPQYFLEYFTTISQQNYQSRFKYPLETIMNKALSYLRDDYGDNLT